jgi:hypothetical protein
MRQRGRQAQKSVDFPVLKPLPVRSVLNEGTTRLSLVAIAFDLRGASIDHWDTRDRACRL